MTTQSSGEGTINQIYCANRSDDSSFTSKVTQHVLIFEISSTSLYAEHHVLSIMALAFYLFFFALRDISGIVDACVTKLLLLTT